VNSIVEEIWGIKFENIKITKINNKIKEITGNIKSDWESTEVIIDTSYPSNKKLKIEWLDIEYTNLREWLKVARMLSEVKSKLKNNPEYANNFSFLDKQYNWYLILKAWRNYISSMHNDLKELLPSLKDEDNQKIFLSYINKFTVWLD
jgi:hypothetical protein